MIIGNQYYPVDHIAKDTVKEIYLGRKTMEGTTPLRSIDQKEPVIRKKFLEEVIGMTVGEYNSYWIKKIYAEGSIPPAVKQSSQEVIETILAASTVPPALKRSSKDVIAYVRKNAGALGYVWKEEAAGITGLKVLLAIEVGDRKP